MTPYFTPKGGLPPQGTLHTGRAVFTEAYAVIPRGVFSDIVTSCLPGWSRTRLWLIARPMTGFSETFSQYVMEVAPGGGSDSPEVDPGAQSVLFVTDGVVALTLGEETHELDAGGYAYIPAGLPWRLHAEGDQPARFHWIRKIWEPAPGLDTPQAFVTNERTIPPIAMPTPTDAGPPPASSIPRICATTCM